jgi:PAS domain S-box-containing protein
MARQKPETIRLHPSAPEPVRGARHMPLTESLLNGILTALPATVLVFDRDRKISSYSGRSGIGGDILGRDLLEFVEPDLHEFYRQQLVRVLENGETLTFDLVGSPERGDPHWVRVRFSPLRIDGAITGVVSMATDIEHERVMQQRADRIRTMFDHVNDGMLVVDISTGTIIECNAGASRVLQVPVEELLSIAPAWLQVTPEGSPRLGWGALLDELADGKTVRGRAIMRDGSESSIEMRATMKNIDGMACAFVLCHDIGSDLEAERARATQERLATVGSLAAGVAHEINNPLTYVIANVQYALDSLTQLQLREQDPVKETERERERKRAQIKEALYEANEGARRVQRIVADLKTLARQGEDRLEPIDVENTLHWAIGVTMAEIRHRARLVKNFEILPPVRGDEARLGQVFVNVLLNAAQAIQPGNVGDNEVTVNTYSRDGRVYIEVLDSGTGIPEQNLTRIFDPFFTTKPRGVGTGLGLSICHEIIASMRGQLTAANRPTGGAKFVVELPAMPAAQAILMRAPRHKSTPPPAQAARILIIDDEALAAKALARILREHRVDIADHAPTGLQMALENDYDIIFCDLMMPELSGMAVHHAVEAAQPTTAERMVFVTGGTFTEEAREFAAHHAARCLFKPFDTSLVKDAVVRLVSARAAAANESC